jgi:hypothetical protein
MHAATDASVAWEPLTGPRLALHASPITTLFFHVIPCLRSFFWHMPPELAVPLRPLRACKSQLHDVPLGLTNPAMQVSV